LNAKHNKAPLFERRPQNTVKITYSAYDIVTFAAFLNKKLIIALPGTLVLAVPSLPTVTIAALMS
jgi:hypothetical protein